MLVCTHQHVYIYTDLDGGVGRLPVLGPGFWAGVHGNPTLWYYESLSLSLSLSLVVVFICLFFHGAKRPLATM